MDDTDLILAAVAEVRSEMRAEFAAFRLEVRALKQPSHAAVGVPCDPRHVELLAAVEALHLRLDADRSKGPRDRGSLDPADVALQLAIREAVGDRRFTVRDLWRHRTAAAGLRTALAAADVTTRRELGKLMARLEGGSGGAFIIARHGSSRDGVIWSVGLRV